MTSLEVEVHTVMLGQVAVKATDMFGRTATSRCTMFTGAVAAAGLHWDLVNKDLEHIREHGETR